MSLEDYVSYPTAFIGLITLGLLWNFLSRPKNFPPGPYGLPFVGYIPFLSGNTPEVLMHMKKKYGSVMSVRFGREDWVILNDYETINEALVNQPEKFSGRPSNFVYDMVTQGKGIIAPDYGLHWKVIRNFGMRTLRGFGVGKKGMEANIIEETPLLIENLITNNGRQSLHHMFSLSVANIISRIVFGARFEYNDKTFLRMNEIVQNFVSNNTEAKMIGIVSLAPILRFIQPFKGAVKGGMENMDCFKASMRKIVKEHEATYDETDIRDFIDAFIKEMKATDGDDPSFNEPHLLQYIFDLFGAGSGTTSGTLTWAMLCFTHYPECQERIAAEIERVIGTSGIPSMKHRDEMPYTCAFIQEIMRHRTQVPLAVLHKTNAEATINGYTIPKDTTIAPNLWSVHYDLKYFENPEIFRPERFLDNEGKFIKSKHVIPFSLGLRRCLGEQLGKMELFIFLTGIVQKLKVVKNPNKPVPSFHVGVGNIVTHEAPAFDVIFEKR